MGVRHPVVIETGDDWDCVNAVHCSVNAGGKLEMRKRVVLNTSS